MTEVFDMILAKGSFSGRGGHILRGTFILYFQDEGVFLSTSEDFLFDGAAEPGWALIKGIPNSSSDPALHRAPRVGDLGPPTRFPFPEISGEQQLPLRHIQSLEGFSTLILWDYASSFLLGVGPFSPAKLSTK